MTAPSPEAQHLHRDANQKTETSGAEELIAVGGIAYEGVVDYAGEILKFAANAGVISRDQPGEENSAAE